VNFFLFGVLATMLSCSSFTSQEPDYEKIADKITVKTAKKLEKEKGLIPVGTGGRMMNDIQMMMIGFNYYHVVDIDTARHLLVDSVEEYLSAINTSEEVRPYLHNYPFTAQNVEIDIYFYGPDRHKVPAGEIKIATANQGQLVYYIDYPEKYTIKDIYEETYEDALKAVNSIHPDNDRDKK